MTEIMSERLGQPILVQNVGGGVAAAQVAQAEADGYTLLATNSTSVTLAPLIQQAPYGMDSFEPVALLGEFQNAYFTGADAPYDTLDELVDYAKAKGRPIKGASQLALDRLVMQYIAKERGVEYIPAPVQGGSGSVQAVMSGDVDVAFSGGRAASSGFRLICEPSSSGVAASGDPAERILDGQLFDSVRIVLVEPGHGVGMIVVAGIGAGGEQVVEAGHAAAVLGRAIALAGNVAGVAHAGLALANVADADFVLPGVAEVVGVGHDGFAGLQNVAQANLRCLLPRRGAPVLVHGQAIGPTVDHELP